MLKLLRDSLASRASTPTPDPSNQGPVQQASTMIKAESCSQRIYPPYLQPGERIVLQTPQRPPPMVPPRAAFYSDVYPTALISQDGNTIYMPSGETLVLDPFKSMSLAQVKAYWRRQPPGPSLDPFKSASHKGQNLASSLAQTKQEMQAAASAGRPTMETNRQLQSSFIERLQRSANGTQDQDWNRGPGYVTADNTSQASTQIKPLEAYGPASAMGSSPPAMLRKVTPKDTLHSPVSAQPPIFAAQSPMDVQSDPSPPANNIICASKLHNMDESTHDKLVTGQKSNKRGRSLFVDISNATEDLPTKKAKQSRRNFLMRQSSQITVIDLLEDSSVSTQSLAVPQTKQFSGHNHKFSPISQNKVGAPHIIKRGPENVAKHDGPNLGRRVWSGEDVVVALSSGREDSSTSTDNTPPPSPIAGASTPLQGFTYTLPKPKVTAPTMQRDPLSEITNKYVPSFLREPEPAIAASNSRLSPGANWAGFSDSIYSDDHEPGSGLDESEGEENFEEDNESADEAATYGKNKEANKAIGATPQSSKIRVKSDLNDTTTTFARLDSDTKFLQDAIKQISALRRRVTSHDTRRKRAEKYLRERGDDGVKGRKMARSFMTEWRACMIASEKAKMEAGEYRKKAKKLIEKAKAAVEGLEEEEGEGDMEGLGGTNVEDSGEDGTD